MDVEGSAYERLTLKQRRFVDAYLGPANGVATRAARMAGYAWPEQMSYRLVHHCPAVRAALNERLQEAAMAANEVMARLTEQGRALYAEYIDEQGNVDLKELRKAGLMRLVKKIRQESNGNLVVEFHDAQSALVQLGRSYGLFTDRYEVEVRDEGAVASLERKLAGFAARLGAGGVPDEPDGGGGEGA